IEAEQAIRQLAGSVYCLLLFERVDEIDGGEEADLLAVMLNGLNTQCRGDVALAGSRSPDQYDIIGGIHEVAPMQLAHERLIDLTGGKVEACQVLVGREAGGLD